MAKKGLWANIHAKRKRIKAGSGEKMRKPGSKGAPTRKQMAAARKGSKSTETWLKNVILKKGTGRKPKGSGRRL